MNKHQKRYESFIESRMDRDLPDTYTEKHHVLPRSLGGSDDKENIITLTGREHFIAHLMLWKAYGGPMTHAFHLMLNRKLGKVTSRQYEILKKEFSIQMSNRIVSEKTRAKISKRFKGTTTDRKGKSWDDVFSQEAAERMREDMSKRSSKFVGEHNPYFGKTHSLAIREKISSVIRANSTPEERSARAATTTGRFWINDGEVSKMIHPVDLQSFLSNGWKKGRMSFKKKVKS